MDDVSVIICAYTLDRWNDLVSAVEAVHKQSFPPYEIILVIDHNPELLEKAGESFPGVRVVANLRKRGLSGARNSGVDEAKGSILAFIDEDAVPEQEWLAKLVHEYQHAGIVGAGGSIRPLWMSGQPAWFPAEFHWVVGCTYLGMPEQAAPVRNLIGANMSFRRRVFEKVGGFQEDMGRIGSYPAGAEETEFCIRVRQANPESILCYQPSACVMHRVPAGRATWKYFRSRCFAEGISKAHVTRLVGAKDGLGNERSYTFKTLPGGFFRGVGQAFRGDLWGLMRSAAIAAGLAITTAGYLYGKSKKPASRTAGGNPKDPVKEG